MGFVLLILVVAGAAAAWWFMRRASAGKRPTAVVLESPKFLNAAGVERASGRRIKLGPVCCQSAQQLLDNWYPEEKAPRLPLDGCDQVASCPCTWEKALDRRVDDRRKSAHDRRGNLRFEDRNDRRSGLDRRKDSGNFWRGSS